ncbi:SNF2-related protein [Streptococcus sp. zg-JUN1979]|uniref:SNF2-related protein n=1 Tax=Streptococcus sp. zg-JUN1979 TaxID=3391450 RepID=UPI0039A7632B
MGRMIPGRVRNQGIALYEEGSISSVAEVEGVIDADIKGEHLRYTLADDFSDCSCQLFAAKHYCEHLAALEYYLKNDRKGQAFAKALDEEVSDDKEPKETSFSHLFLDSLLGQDDDTTRYRLFAYGELSATGSEVWWTLKLNRLPDEKSYIIRDVRAFLTTVQKEGFYQIGKHYFEPLTFDQFDEPSQQLLLFLWKFVPDSEQFGADNFLRNNGRYMSFASGFFAEAVKYLTALSTFDFEADSQSYDMIEAKGLAPEDELFSFSVVAERHSVILIIEEHGFSSLLNNHLLRRQDTFYLLTPRQRKIIQAINSLPLEADNRRCLFFTHDDQQALATGLLYFKLVGPVDAPKNYMIQDFTTHFYFDNPEEDILSLQIAFDYGNDIVVDKREDLINLPFTSHYRHQEKLFRFLEHSGFQGLFYNRKAFEGTKELYHFFTQLVPECQKRGVVHLSETLDARRIKERPKINFDINKSGFLEVSFDFSDLAEDDIDQALSALLDNQAYFVDKTGKMLVFDEQMKKVSKHLQAVPKSNFQSGRLELNRGEAYRLAGLFAKEEYVDFSEAFEKLAYDVTHPEHFEMPEVKVKANLRDYQRLGVRWLSMLDYYGFGGILADDMGLGKTLQVIAFLSAKLTPDTHVLILAPSSLIFNWQDEFRKFAPQLDVAVSYGLKPARDKIIETNHQVIITSYAAFRQDFEMYQNRAYSYDYLILDEAQAMKNTQTKIAKSLRAFEVKQCFALSGTPIENKLLEIWSIFQIVMPGLLPPKRAFAKMPSEQIARYISPFVLRRRKEDVLPELPDLTEITYVNELADSQKAIYLAQLRQMQEHLAGASDETINRQKMEILSGITRLRQICDSPKLFMDYEEESGKVESLKTLLEQIRDNGHRALIFSQFRGMLDIAEKELLELGMTTYKLTGSTPARERQEMTKAFNQGSCDTFLISLKAGGVGLNLTGADTVILLDLWWNPAVEMQAISRAHRLGQKQNVDVYRLITRGTIEEKILELQESKKHLVKSVLDGSEVLSSMSVDDIREILGIDKKG